MLHENPTVPTCVLNHLEGLLADGEQTRDRLGIDGFLITGG